MFGLHRLPQQNTDCCRSLRCEGESAAILLSPEEGKLHQVLMDNRFEMIPECDLCIQGIIYEFFNASTVFNIERRALNQS